MSAEQTEGVDQLVVPRQFRWETVPDIWPTDINRHKTLGLSVIKPADGGYKKDSHKECASSNCLQYLL